MSLERIEIKNSLSAKVELNSVSGTPYKWEMLDAPKSIQSRSNTPQTKKAKQNKADLKSIFMIEARKKGTYEIEFVLSAPFASKPLSKKKIEITFH